MHRNERQARTQASILVPAAMNGHIAAIAMEESQPTKKHGTGFFGWYKKETSIQWDLSGDHGGLSRPRGKGVCVSEQGGGQVCSGITLSAAIVSHLRATE